LRVNCGPVRCHHQHEVRLAQSLTEPLPLIVGWRNHGQLAVPISLEIVDRNAYKRCECALKVAAIA
jgi:hypothetical protein